MPTYIIRGPDGRTYDVPAPEGTPEANLIAQAQRMAMAGPQATPGAAPMAAASSGPQTDLGIVGNALRDTLGMGDRPNARTIWNPETATEKALWAIAPSLLMGGGIAQAGVKAAQFGLPAVAGRLGFGGALGAAKGALDPNDTAAAGATRGLLAGAAAEGGATALGAVARGGSGALNLINAAIQKVLGSKPGEGLIKAVAALEDRVKNLPVSVPSLNLTPNFAPGATTTVEQAASQIGALKGPAFEKARDELAMALDAIRRRSATGQFAAGPPMGDVLRTATQPSPLAAIADKIAAVPEMAGNAITSTPARVAADTLAAQHPREAIVTGIGALSSAPSLVGSAASMIPGVGAVMDR